MSSSGREDGGYPGPSGRGQAWERAFWLKIMIVIGIAKLDFKFKMRFEDFWLRVNYYYPPDDGLLAAGWKKLLLEVIGRIFKPASPLKQKAEL